MGSIGMVSKPDIPTEVCEYTIDGVAKNRNTFKGMVDLAACALVSRS